MQVSVLDCQRYLVKLCDCMIWDKILTIAMIAFKLSLFRCSLSHAAFLNLNRIMIFENGNICIFFSSSRELSACYRDGLAGASYSYL